jgi:hypothetical protein
MQSNYLTDFSDRISPMLVKELRQGMRAKTFIGVFLALQIFLGVMLLSAGSSATNDQVGTVISTIIFVFFSLAVLVVQPLRGTGALAAEMKGNTIDMMVLTRLSAWRIVCGKWLAIVSQSALLLTTIVPYLILRYFFGGMNLLGEMVMLLLLFLTSMALTAVTVGLSGCTSVIVRSMLPVLGLPIALYSLLVMMMMRAFGGGGSTDIMDVFTLSTPEARIGVGAYVAALLYLGASMLSLGASLIAPPAENHSVLRRMAALLLVLALLGLGITGLIDHEWVILLVCVVVAPAIILALTDSAPLVSTVCEPFVRRGVVGKAAGWLFYPTWASGVLFAIVIGIVGIATIYSGSTLSYFDEEAAVVLLAFYGGLMFPAVWQVFLFRGDGQRLSHYLLLLAGSFILLGVLSAIAGSMNNGDFLWVFAWNPLVFLPMLESSGTSDSSLLGGVIVVNLILLTILGIKAVADCSNSLPVLRQASENIQARV